MWKSSRVKLATLICIGAAALAAGLSTATVGSQTPQKVSLQERANRFRANLGNEPAAKLQYLREHPGPRPAPAPHGKVINELKTGIINLRQSPFAGDGQHFVMNSWQELNGGILTQVYAGAIETDPAQGFLIERHMAWPARIVLSGHEYYSPLKSGGLTIVAATGNTLTLNSTGGREFTFDVIREAFMQG